MKKTKLIYTAFMLPVFVISFILVGCTKEINKPTDEQTNGIEKTAGGPGPDSKMRTLYTNSGSGYIMGCAEPPKNCLPDVVITPESLNTLKSTSNKNSAYTDFIIKFKKNEISNFFKTGDYMALFPQLVLFPNVITELQNEKIKLYHQKGANDGLDYYIGLPKNVKFESDWIGSEKCVFVIKCDK